MFNFFLNLLLVVSFADPFQWLEENTSQTRKWVEEQQEISNEYFAQLDLEEIEKELRTLTHLETWWLPEEHNGVLYFCKRGEKENKAVLVSMKEDEMMVLVDPNQSSREVMLAGFTLSPDGNYLAYGLSIAGSDQLEWHILDLQSKEELPECFTEIQFSKLLWDETCEKIYYIKNCTDVYAHTLGTPLSEDQLLYHPEEEFIVFYPEMVCNGRYILIEERRQVVKRVCIRLIDLKEGGSFILVPPGDFDVTFVGSVENEIFFISDEACCMGKLIAITPQKEVRTVINEGKDLLHDVSVVENQLACCYYANASAVLKIYSLDGHYLYTVTLPDKGTVELSHSCDSLFYSYTDFFTPVQIYKHRAGLSEPLYTPLASEGEIETSQVWYTSKDGTRISMFLTHRKDCVIDEKTPILLYGYGGFGIPVTPFFRSYLFKWVKSGGLLAVPNLRGGKEYGSKWYENGKLHNKQNVFDDFIAAAEWLIQNKGGPIGIFGSSNGGLLAGAVLTQRPDLFSAAVVNKGVLDMLRFHLFTIGRFWICDYGNPENPEDYSYLLSYSPYHNVVNNTYYPPTLINTADHDDRVVPMHSYKFYAALKEANGSDHPILLRLERSCGHGGNDSREQMISFGRDLLAFFYSELAFKKEIDLFVISSGILADKWLPTSSKCSIGRD